mmetsp:Transcript_49920/g.118073  ORF Transcript_49920/g.118073 Transcript_49920/m.118073 type:complete len:204 (-) Transcript_49920:140-751(-)
MARPPRPPEKARPRVSRWITSFCEKLPWHPGSEHASLAHPPPAASSSQLYWHPRIPPSAGFSHDPAPGSPRERKLSAHPTSRQAAVSTPDPARPPEKERSIAPEPPSSAAPTALPPCSATACGGAEKDAPPNTRTVPSEDPGSNEVTSRTSFRAGNTAPPYEVLCEVLCEEAFDPPPTCSSAFCVTARIHCACADTRERSKVF